MSGEKLVNFLIKEVKGMKKIRLLILLGVLLCSTQGAAQEEAITKGMDWLKRNQNVSGSWGDEKMIASSVIDTTVVLDTFYYLNETATAYYTRGIEWLGTQNVFSCSLLARKIKTLAEAGIDTTNLVGLLISYQNEDGGFGPAKNYTSTNLDTIFALFAFKAVNYFDATVIKSAIWYLVSNQNIDGDFGIAGKTALWADETLKQNKDFSRKIISCILY